MRSGILGASCTPAGMGQTLAQPRRAFRPLLGGFCRLICLVAIPCRAADSVVVQTNWVEQSITNVVELRMPKNLFVTEFHTNWFDQFTTNFVTLYQTNHTTKYETNQVVVDLIKTNVVDARITNWVTKYVTNTVAVSRVRTNSVDFYHTNWIGKTMTNDFLV